MSKPIFGSEPLFLVGTGRCGSTVLHRMLAEHPHLAFISRVLTRFPTRLDLQRAALRLWDFSLLPSRLRERVGPTEGWPFWDHHIPGFSTPYRDIRRDDVSAKAEATTHKLFAEMTAGSRQRVLVKFTGWTRLGFVKHVFPSAKIVHIIREPHPVVRSMLDVSWWHGWGGPEKWRWGPLSEGEQRVWASHGQSFVVLAAIEWAKIMRAYRESLEVLSPEDRADVLEVCYDELCNAREETMSKLLDFASLPDDTGYRARLDHFVLRSQDGKWRSDLSETQQHSLEHALDELGWQELMGKR